MLSYISTWEFLRTQETERHEPYTRNKFFITFIKYKQCQLLRQVRILMNQYQVSPYTRGAFHSCQSFRDFRSEIQWNGKSSGKNFRKFRTTFWAYPSSRNFRNYRIFCVPFAMSVGFSLPGRARTSCEPKEPQTKWLRKCINALLVAVCLRFSTFS